MFSALLGMWNDRRASRSASETVAGAGTAAGFAPVAAGARAADAADSAGAEGIGTGSSPAPPPRRETRMETPTATARPISVAAHLPAMSFSRMPRPWIGRSKDRGRLHGLLDGGIQLHHFAHAEHFDAGQSPVLRGDLAQVVGGIENATPDK